MKLSKEMEKSLEILAGVSEDMYETTERGLKFTFENSLRCNTCQIIQYHDKVIMEFRKVTNDLLQGKQNILVSEDVVSNERIQGHFMDVTGIYLDYMGM